MEEKAYRALEAIAEGADGLGPEHAPWIKALKEIRWVIQTDAGLTLTAEGRQARDEMAASRLSGPAPVRTPRPRRQGAD